MSGRVCPWWLGYFLASPLRRWFDDPSKLLKPYVRPGMTVLEPGPGMGFFTLELARLAGPHGRVVALDVQPRMISGLKRRVERAGLADRVETRVVSQVTLGLKDLTGAVDFTLAYAVVHELPDESIFFEEVAKASKSGASLLLVEPAGHVKADEFEAEIVLASQAGLSVVDRPAVRRSRAAVLRKA